MSSGGCSTCLEVIFAVVLPPLGVFFRYGCCSSEFFISLLLTALCYVPGIVYSLYVILRTHRRGAALRHARLTACLYTTPPNPNT
ncbi:unnamed protein product [Miscanthus lutarioriparius]|uniref:Hydrophobic protein OSR8 n=1 Tax=Miscanthus lutarioriparius TaxID=422564 RepID=A0A811S130_9POAL|nr:unnamed protein product [Miscanthus lutarioriparius]